MTEALSWDDNKSTGKRVECDQIVVRVVSSWPPIGTVRTAKILSLKKTNPLASALVFQPVMDCVPDRRIGILLANCADAK